MVKPYLSRANLYPEGLNHDLPLPYGLTPPEVWDALDQVVSFLHEMNGFLVGNGYDRLEEILLGNSLSGFISELVVKNLGKSASTLTRNTKVGGHPDLILADTHQGDAVLRAEEGIEVKTSIQNGSWQGHNPEESWVLVVQYSVDTKTEPVEMRRPLEILKVMIAQLEENDWSFSGRSETSRRTPTASILRSGTAKLHGSAIYEHPNYVRNLDKMTAALEAIHEERTTKEA